MRFIVVSGLCLLLCCGFVQAKPAVISIILDDLGVRKHQGEQALELNKDITFAFLPFENYTNPLLSKAQQLDREVMLHLPMESIARIRRNKGVLKMHMPHDFFRQTLRENLQALPGIVGVNNHRGSLLTQDQRSMDWVMEELKQRQLFFIDSRTTAESVAAETAKKWQIPTLSRQVFLDHTQKVADIEKQFKRLLAIAKKQGWAIAIGHPHPETLQVLQQQLPQLDQTQFQLQRMSQLMRSKFPEFNLHWNHKTELGSQTLTADKTSSPQ